MFCGKCGTQIPDGAGFCPSCGNATGAQTAAANNTTQVVTEAPKKKVSTNTIIGIVAVAAVVVALAIILISIFAGGSAGSGSPEAAVENYVEATFDFDIDKLLECIHEDIVNRTADEEYDGDVDALKEELQEVLDMSKGMMGDAEFDYDIIDSTDIKGDDLDELTEDFKDEFDLKISAAAEVEFEVSIKGEMFGEEINETEEATITVVKIDGKWYIHPDDFDIG